MSKKNITAKLEMRKLLRISKRLDDANSTTLKEKIAWFKSAEFADMRVCNMTGHDIVLYAADGKTVLRKFKSDDKAYVRGVIECRDEEFYGFPIAPYDLGEVGLPTQNGNDILVCIVPPDVGEYVRTHGHNYRGMVLGEDTSDASAVRDKDDMLVGVKRFVLYKFDRLPENHPLYGIWTQ
jgi:hypothetical protein